MKLKRRPRPDPRRAPRRTAAVDCRPLPLRMSLRTWTFTTLAAAALLFYLSETDIRLRLGSGSVEGWVTPGRLQSVPLGKIARGWRPVLVVVGPSGRKQLFSVVQPAAYEKARAAALTQGEPRASPDPDGLSISEAPLERKTYGRVLFAGLGRRIAVGFEPLHSTRSEGRLRQR